MRANLHVKTLLFFLFFIGIQHNIYANTIDTVEKCNEEINLFSTDTFITKWTTTVDNTQITFPLYFDTGSLMIDWGDGTVESNIGEAPTHTYVTAGDYIVTVLSGQIDRVRFSLASSSAPYIVDVMQWGNNVWTSTEFAFYNCNNLDVTATDAPDLSAVIKTANMFNGCTSLVGTAAFNTWNTSNVQDMVGMFSGCASFNQPINNWNTSSVTLSTFMFNGATTFNQPLDNWNVGNITDMTAMFKDAEAFNQPLNNWNTSNVTSSGLMFSNCISFNQPLDNWNVGNVTDMTGMFKDTEVFNQPLNNWDTSSVTNTTLMFESAQAFNRPLDNWDVSNVTNMARMFQNCQAFDQNIGNWDISSIVSLSNFDGLSNMFDTAGISTLNYDNTLIGWATLDANETQIPTGITFDAGSSEYCTAATERNILINTYGWTITDQQSADPLCTALPEADRFITKWTTTADNTQITFPLYFDTGSLIIDWGDGTIESGVGQAPTHTYVTAGTYIISVLSGQIDRVRFSLASSSRPYIVDVMQWGNNSWDSTEYAFDRCINLDVTATDAPDLSRVIKTAHMFNGCSSLVGTTAFNTWNTSNVEDMFGMFTSCISFNQDLDAWNMSRVDELRRMFAGAIIFNGNISTWDMSDARLMASMFSGAQAFNQPLNNWNVSNVTNMSGMFFGATNFNQPLDNWNVGNVTNMSNMFRQTEAFNQPLHNWDTSSVEDMSLMFFETTAFNQPINNWNVSNVTNMVAMFSGAESFNQPLDNWDVSNATNMARMFQNCQVFDQNLGNWDISSVVSLTSYDGLSNMFNATGLSLINYDNTLIGWNTLDSGETQIPTGINFNGGNSNYCLSQTARQNLINTYSWTISDAGLSCPNVIVPDVVGLSQSDAETAITDVVLQVGTVTGVYSATIPAGTVISQDPVAEASVAYGSNVNIEVSLGNYPLLITGIISKNNESLGAIELYVTNDIPDLSIYAIGVENGGNGSEGAEYYLSGSASAGDFLYLAEYPSVFQNFFGFAPDFDMGGTNGLLPSGNNAVELFININNTPTLVDVFGDPNVNGFGTSWAYKNSWVYRKTGTVASGSFVLNDWRIPGPEIISSVSITNSNAPVPFPTGTYGQPYDDVPPVAVCQDITFEIDQGNFTVDANLIDNGSTDNVGVTFMQLDDSSYFCSNAGDNLVTLTVYDAAGNKDTCTATINIIPAAPQIICQDITVDLGFNGQAAVSFHDITNGISGACIGEGTPFYVSTSNPEESGTNNLFDGVTTTNSTTDDALGFGTEQYYQDFSFTVPSDGNYLPSFSFTSSTSDDILVAIVSDQPVAPNTGVAPSRPGFLNGFIYEGPSTYQGSITGDDEVVLTAGVTYYMQVIVFNGDDPSMLSTGTFTGGFGGISQNLDEVTYTTANLGDNTLYAYFTDDLGRMTSCAATVTVVNADPFITTWKTDNPGDSNDNQITLPTTGNGYSFDVDWGDGNIDLGIGGSFITHTYATPGTYTVKITGDFPRMYFNGGGDAEKLLTIEQWGDIEWASMDSAFEGCSNLNITNPAIDTPNLSNVTNMQDMFYDCTSFNGDITNWDVSNVQDFNEMFGYCEVFNQPIGNWNMSSATDLSYMFYEALAFNQPLNNWNTSNVLLMEGVFSETESFNQDLNNWNVTNVTSMYEMFDAADVFNGNISSWNVSNVEDMRDTFDEAYAFNQDISGWNVSSVTTMENMFASAEVFNQDISNWNVSAVTDMESMFNGADAFNQDIGNWDVSNVTNMADMFRGADAFDQNLGNWDLTSIIDTGSSNSGLRDMFGSGPSGISLSRSNYDNTLIGWNTDSSGIPNDGIDDIPQNIIFGGGKSNYCESESQRQNLIDTHGWTINDQGKACLTFRVKVYLQGASLNNDGGSLNEMRDDLRVAGLIPTTSPYPDALTCDPTIFTDFDDEEAAVDWIWMELRDPTDNTNIVFSRSFLLDRLGNIYDTTLGAIELGLPDGDYYVVVKHRNHLGIMSATPISLSASSITTVDFRDGSTPTYGTNAQTTFGMPAGIMGMWAGNVNDDAFIQYAGTSSDTPDILSAVLNNDGNILNFPTHTINGYQKYDINMDGSTQYSGTDPDTPILLQNVLAHPGNFLNFSTYQIIEQLPEND